MAISAITSFVVGGSDADYTSGSLRENFEDFITIVSPEKTPFTSMIGTESVGGPHVEWQLDSIPDPDRTARDAGVELSDLTAQSYTAERVGNLTQVFARRVDVDETTIRSRTAGASNWLDHELMKVKKALRRDWEAKALYYDVDTTGNADDVVLGNSSNVRSMGSLSAYAGIWNFLDADGTPQFVNASGTTSNVGDGSLVPNGTAFSILNDSNRDYGNKVVQLDEAPTNVSVTLDHINSTLRVINENGGMVNTLMMPTSLRAAVTKLFVDNGAVAERRVDAMAAKLNISVDMVMTDFDDVALVHNYLMQSDAGEAVQTLIAFDTGSIKKGVLQRHELREDMSAHRGFKGQLDCEETLIVKDPSSLAIIANAIS